ncbi:hypothetical protein HY085_01730 [Candidatus Gottesmanbacteria bacterium]|nr:hypothetical protein [Candidatus Gottesmanbacteria bacterium]
MDKRLKYALYVFIFGVAGLAVVLQKLAQPKYFFQDVLGEEANLTLFIEPDDGRELLLGKIRPAGQILAEVYLLSDPEVIEALKTKPAKIILEQHPFGNNTLNFKTKPILEAAGLLINWGNPNFPYTHAKFMVFDNQVVCILNLNLTKTAFEKNREYNICSEKGEDITETINIFNADWERKNYVPTNKHLVVSPNNSRGKLTALINSAEKSLDIEMEVLTDKDLINLVSAKTKNIPVRIILPEKKKVDNPPVPGAQVKILVNPYPHAKLIITDGQRAYVGSINLSAQSLDENRELGILVSQSDILGRLTATFNRDWATATNK